MTRSQEILKRGQEELSLSSNMSPQEVYLWKSLLEYLDELAADLQQIREEIA